MATVCWDGDNAVTIAGIRFYHPRWHDMIHTTSDVVKATHTLQRQEIYATSAYMCVVCVCVCMCANNHIYAFKHFSGSKKIGCFRGNSNIKQNDNAPFVRLVREMFYDYYGRPVRIDYLFLIFSTEKRIKLWKFMLLVFDTH